MPGRRLGQLGTPRPLGLRALEGLANPESGGAVAEYSACHGQPEKMANI
jgi:hypothetical protein